MRKNTLKYEVSIWSGTTNFAFKDFLGKRSADNALTSVLYISGIARGPGRKTFCDNQGNQENFTILLLSRAFG